MADSRDITGKNRKFKGTSGVVMPKGSTAERADTESGEIRFNTTTELMEYYDGNQWKPIDAPPTISSISTTDATGSNTVLTADGSTIYTITITGGNFGVGVNVKFIGNTGTEYTAGNINRVSGSSITCTTLSNMGTADDPYDIQVNNPSGLSALLEDAFSFNAAPEFVTASGTLGSVYDGQVISGTTLNAGATDAETDTITFSIVSGSLPGSGLSISSSTGAITGTLGGTPSLGNYPFTVRAATAEGIAERVFSIDVIANPFISATGGTVTESGDYKIHTFTGDGCFVVSNAGSPPGSTSVDYLVVAGGGGGGAGAPGSVHAGGGGGAGGLRYSASTYCNPAPAPTAGTELTITAVSYPITVGSGGAGQTSGGPGQTGAQGSTSTFSTITSAGGGGGGTRQGPENFGGDGGSGGGASSDGTGGSGNTPPVSPSQGNNGGSANPNPAIAGMGGGGGAGAVGTTGTDSANGPGGNGLVVGISGSNTTYAGGGGGGGNAPPQTIPVAGTGGSGGGGNGGSSPSDPGDNGSNGTANTGGGAGGGGAKAAGGTGGSGIVVIRYKFQ